MLKSRKNYISTLAFREHFLATLMPGIIDRHSFIQWHLIQEKMEQYAPLISFLETVPAENPDVFCAALTDFLLKTNQVQDYIKSCFELLGHTDSRKFVTSIDHIRFADISQPLNAEKAAYFACLFTDLGLLQISHTRIRDYFLGVQIGLETNRRKNTGGYAFTDLIGNKLSEIIADLKEDFPISMTSETRIYYNNGTSHKKVDYCIMFYDTPCMGIEVNFYTVVGSKPTEIKRSYIHVNQELEKVATELIWITDGIGYLEMKKSIQEAFEIHQNIYNYRMFMEHFAQDLVQFLKQLSGKIPPPTLSAGKPLKLF